MDFSYEIACIFCTFGQVIFSFITSSLGWFLWNLHWNAVVDKYGIYNSIPSSENVSVIKCTVKEMD